MRWIDRNQRDEDDPLYSSRIVAKEIKTHANPDLFAAILPVEYIRFLLSCVESWQWSSRQTRFMIQDVSKACLFAQANLGVYVAVPEEDKEAGKENKCSPCSGAFMARGTKRSIGRSAAPRSC